MHKRYYLSNQRQTLYITITFVLPLNRSFCWRDLFDCVS